MYVIIKKLLYPNGRQESSRREREREREINYISHNYLIIRIFNLHTSECNAILERVSQYFRRN